MDVAALPNIAAGIVTILVIGIAIDTPTKAPVLSAKCLSTCSKYSSANFKHAYGYGYSLSALFYITHMLYLYLF